MKDPPGTTRAAFLFLRLRLTRLRNRWSVLLRRKGGASPRRTATPGKRPVGSALSVLLGLLLLSSYLMLALQMVSNLEKALELQGAGAESFAAGTRFVLLLLFAAVVLVSMANREMSQRQWDLEWLVTLPVPLSSLIKIRIIERALLNTFGLFSFFPFLCALGWHHGLRVGAPFAAIAITLALLLIVALIEILVESCMRLWFAPSRLRNLQGLFSIAGLACFYPALAVGFASGASPDYFVYSWARSLPAWADLLPTSVASSALAARSVAAAAIPAGVLALETTAAVVLALRALERIFSRGVESHGARESGGRGRALQKAGRRGFRLPGFLTGIQRKELTLLGRDRNFLVQTLVLPVVIGGFQILINPGIIQAAGSAPQHLGTLAFGITAYVLMFSAFQVLNSEGAALWLLHTLPRPLERIVLEKAFLWGALACLYPALIFGGSMAHAGSISLKALGFLVLVLAGVPVYAVIAACLGVLGSNPLELEPQRRVRVQFTYLYMIVASLYSYAIYASTLWQRLALMALTISLAFALWQKVRDHLPYLLDPVAGPPPRASLADGLIAAMLFFVLQGVVTLACIEGQVPAPAASLAAFTVAGAVTFLSVRLVYWRRGVQEVPRFLGSERCGAVRAGALWGVAAGAWGIAYLGFARASGLLSEEVARQLKPDARSAAWVVMLAVVAAPVFEEFIFRGLIFGGLRRSFALAPSVLASAAVFALEHPPASVVPVLGLGICAALAYERKRSLLSPMTAHMVYNVLILGAQMVMV